MPRPLAVVPIAPAVPDGEVLAAILREVLALARDLDARVPALPDDAALADLLRAIRADRRHIARRRQHDEAHTQIVELPGRRGSRGPVRRQRRGETDEPR